MEGKGKEKGSQMTEHPKLQNFVQESVSSIVWIYLLSLFVCIVALGMILFDFANGHYEKHGPVPYTSNEMELHEMIIWQNMY